MKGSARSLYIGSKHIIVIRGKVAYKGSMVGSLLNGATVLEQVLYHTGGRYPKSITTL